ncbi:PREDICTED: probable transcription factor At1g11510 isoform X1 [Camelina sativa]|uniref:Probable transcription factor At1g11510 isoform X1 n=1 Tax=Camelina sativa TaxID=90675 RepID=A0ABM0WA01_CAMSA|nr:PREDICTED: probable transcription factor At1g11510 isoform X1 [Camelina sativa]
MSSEESSSSEEDAPSAAKPAPAAQSGSEEGEESASSEEDAPSAAKPAPAAQSGSEEGEESSSDEEDAPSAAKPAFAAQSGSEEGEDAPSVAKPTPAAQSGSQEREAMEVVTTKRSRESSSDEDKGAKRIKERKPYFHKVWTEDDEIALLQGMVDHNNDTVRVYDNLKEKFSFECTRVQFMEKIRHLKQKYLKNVAKVKNGNDPTFLKAHDHKVFHLSKSVFGKKSKNIVGKNVESSSSLVGALVGFGMNELGAEEGLSKLSSEDKKRFEEQLKTLQSRELKFHLKKAKFFHQLLRRMDEASS